MIRPVVHEVTLMFFSTNEDGTHSVCDVVETSRHHAYGFISRNIRRAHGPEYAATHVAALAPGVPWHDAKLRAL